MVLSVIRYGNKALRTNCLPIGEITDEIKQLAQEMIETMDLRDGIGLAAPQVGRLIRMFVLRNYEETKEGKVGLSGPKVYINPKILKVSRHTCFDSEACLSIPGIRAEIERPVSLVIEASGLDGIRFSEEMIGYNARVRMHENDHLNGVLFIDRMESRARKKIDPLLKKIEKEAR